MVNELSQKKLSIFTMILKKLNIPASTILSIISNARLVGQLLLYQDADILEKWVVKPP